MQSIKPFAQRELKNLDDILIAMSELGFSNPPEIRELFLNPELIKNSDPELAPVVYCGFGRTYLISGELSKAIKYYRDALSLIHDLSESKSMLEKSDVFAYVHDQAGVFYKLIGDKDSAINHFKIAKLFVKSEFLKSVVNYDLATIMIKPDPNDNINTIKKYIKEFKDLNLITFRTMALHKLGVLYASLSDFIHAENIYNEGIKLSEKHSLKYHTFTFLISFGYLEYRRGNYNESLNKYFKIIHKPDSFYQRTLILENIALCYEKLNDYPTALNYWMESLNLCEDHGVISSIPVDCLKIGEIYVHKFSNFQKARYFYKKGYKCSMDLLQQGIKLNGYRLQVVQRYNEFLIQRHSIFQQEKDEQPIPAPFIFARNKKWQDIKNIFQYNVIIYYKYKYRSVESTVRHLKLKRTTYNVIQRKLKQKGFEIPDFRYHIKEFENEAINADLQSYITKLTQHGWKTINKIFEKEVLEFLLADKNLNKFKLAKILKISYPAVKLKTDYIIQQV